MQILGDKASQILAVWLLPLGYLIYKSGFFPRILGVLMVIAGLGYMTDFLVVVRPKSWTPGIINKPKWRRGCPDAKAP
jgi:p-aminobenzoyl-glutamate transporter AbgT